MYGRHRIITESNNSNEKNKKELTPALRKDLKKMVEPAKTRKRKILRLNKTRHIKVPRNETRRKDKRQKKTNATRKIKY